MLHTLNYGLVKLSLLVLKISNLTPFSCLQVYANEGSHPEIPPLQETTAIYRAQKKMSLGIGNTNGDDWYRLRSNSHQRMLRPKELHRYIPGVDRVTSDFVRRIEGIRYGVSGGEVTDLRTEVGLWNMEASGLLVFDKRIG